MINDSDEEVIYGSDEESRRPLNSRSHRATSEDIWSTMFSKYYVIFIVIK